MNDKEINLSNENEPTVYLLSKFKIDKMLLSQIEDMVNNEIIESNRLLLHNQNENVGTVPLYLTDKHLFIWDKYGFTKIDEDEIVYLEASRSYCNIYMNKDKKTLVSVPMAEVGKYLQTDKFIRIHRTFIINIDYIKRIAGNTIILINEKELTIGREYRKAVFARFVFIGSRNKKYNQAQQQCLQDPIKIADE